MRFILVVILSAGLAAAAAEVRVGVIGSGCIGIEHIRNIHLCADAHVSAVADSHPPSRDGALACLRELGVDAGVTLMSDYRELLASPDVDAIVICTPNDHHIEVLRDAFRTGKHCLVEKPLCTEVAHLAEAEALAEQALAEARAAQRAEPCLWCGMEYRFMPTISRMIRDADAGVIGELRMLTIREHRFPFLRKVGDWNRHTSRTGGTLVEKCCHHFDLMRRILRAEPVRIIASGGQDVNHLSETYGGRRSDILDNAYVIIDFDNGARAMLDLCMCDSAQPRAGAPPPCVALPACDSPQPRPLVPACASRFAEASKHQEEVCLVGSHGKLEAFAPSHGVRTIDESEPNYRRGLRNPANVASWDFVDPPPPELCGELLETHEGVDPALLEAGNHCGATYEEVRAFTEAVLSGQQPMVTLSDGTKAVLMGLAAHRSIAKDGQPILWSEMLEEFDAASSAAKQRLAAA